MLTTNAEFAQNDLADTIRLFCALDDINCDVNYFNTPEGIEVKVSVCGNLTKLCYPEVVFTDVVIKKRHLKRYLKRSLYIALSKHFGKKLPWGSLTGIRPVKLAFQLMQEGLDYQKELEEFFLVSRKKIDMVKKIVEIQSPMLKAPSGGSLFVNIPFCPTRCYYCSFISALADKSQTLLEPYTELLIQEITAAKKILPNPKSVYIGGGTPVSLPLNLLKKIIIAAAPQSGTEFTVEAGRADCINEEVLKLFKDLGVTRVCVNPQTFNDSTLKKIGRNHTGADVIKAYEGAKKLGFDVNMDLIAGLEGETLEMFLNTVKTAVNLKPENITVHTLSVKAGSKLKESKITPQTDNISDMVDASASMLDLAGYDPYYMYRQKYTSGNLENTGYTLQGKACVYNVDIMEENANIVACGAGAMSKRGYADEGRIERFKNAKDIKTYIEKAKDNILSKDIFFR